MRRLTAAGLGMLSCLLGAAVSNPAEEPKPPRPFKLGTLERQGRIFLGLVLENRAVIEVAAANADLERRHPDWKRLAIPSDMKELIARYEEGLRERLHAIAWEVPSSTRAPHVHEVRDLKVKPPVL